MMSLRARLVSVAVGVLGGGGSPLPGRRVEVCVPASPRGSGSGNGSGSGSGWRSWWQRRGRLRWAFGLVAAAARRSADRNDAARPDHHLNRLLDARRDFIDALGDVQTDSADRLLDRIRAARSLRELWHLRPDVFDAVARRHAQAEADCRLARLNRHFPTRAPRSGFGNLS